MIYPHDLMLGNWVLHGERPVQVTFLHRAREINGLIADHFHPIPLTPELMEKIGWKRHSHNEYLKSYHSKNNYFVAFPQKDDAYRKIADPISGLGDCEVVVHFLHELQNLYRWETGKILEIIL